MMTISTIDQFKKKLIDKEPAAELKEALDKAINRYTAPRKKSYVRKFLMERLSPGEYYIFGAGSHTSMMLGLIDERDDIHILGIVDNNYKNIEFFENYKVVSPLEYASDLCTPVIVAHQERELDMFDALISVGVKKDRIWLLYSSENYTNDSYESFLEEKIVEVEKIKSSYNDSIDTVIVSSGPQHWMVINDRQLMEASLALPNVIVLYIGREEHCRSTVEFPVVNLNMSHQAALEITRYLAPEVVYARTNTGYDNLHMGLLLQSVVPDTRVIQEVYDWGMSLPNAVLAEQCLMTASSIDDLRAIEYGIVNSSLTLVGKQGGTRWNDFLKYTDVDYYLFYPGIYQKPFQSEKIKPTRDKRIRLAFAGNMLRYGVNDVGESGLSCNKFIPLFKRLAVHPLIAIDIYNSAHAQGVDEFFSGYYRELEGTDIQYYPCLPYDELIEKLQDYDFGLMLTDETDADTFPVDNAQTTLPNRMMGYIQAGLPVIANQSLLMAAELLSEFDAGITFSWERMAELPDIIQNACVEEKKSGVQRMRSSMCAYNASQLEALFHSV